MEVAPSRQWVFALIFAILSAILFAVMSGIFPKGAASMPAPYGGSVMAFEFARSLPDLRAIFGNGDDPAQIARLSMMRLGTYHDMGFALLYPAFLSAAALALLRITDWRVLYAVPAFAVLAGLADLLENWMLLDILAAFRSGGFSPWLLKLGWPVWIKFLSIAVSNGILGVALASLGGFWRIAGYGVAVAALVPAVLAFIIPSYFAGAMAFGIGIGWAILLIASAMGAWVWWQNR
jgi:hypothetical protein